MPVIPDIFLDLANLWFDWLTVTWWRQFIVLIVGLGLIWAVRRREPQLRRSLAIICALLLIVPPFLILDSGNAASPTAPAPPNNVARTMEAAAGPAPVKPQRTSGTSDALLQQAVETAEITPPGGASQDLTIASATELKLAPDFKTETFDLPAGSLPLLLFVLWLGGCGIVVWRIWTCSLPLWRLARTSQAVSVAVLPEAARDYDIRCHAAVEVPFVCAWPGAARVVLPAAWSVNLDEARQAVLAHELAHIKQHDHIWMWFFATLKVVLWWNPLVWMLSSKYHASSELCCDDSARSATNMSAEEFARTLLAIAPRLRSKPSLAVAFSHKPSLIKRRITHQFQPKRNTRMRKTLITAFCLSALPLLLFMQSTDASAWGLVINMNPDDSIRTEAAANQLIEQGEKQQKLNELHEQIKLQAAEIQAEHDQKQIQQQQVQVQIQAEALQQEALKLSQASKELESVSELKAAQKTLVQQQQKENEALILQLQSQAEKLNTQKLEARAAELKVDAAELEASLQLVNDSLRFNAEQLEAELLKASKEILHLMERKQALEEAEELRRKQALERAEKEGREQEIQQDDSSADPDSKQQDKQSRNEQQRDKSFSFNREYEGVQFNDCAVHVTSFLPDDRDERIQYFTRAHSEHPAANILGARVFYTIDVNADGKVTNVTVNKEASHILYGPNNAANLQGFIDKGLLQIEFMEFHPKYVNGRPVDGSMVWMFEHDPIKSLKKYRTRIESLKAELL